MNKQELEDALRKKIFEEMGRNINFTFIDKQKVMCGICRKEISLKTNCGFDNLIKHFNGEHSRNHRCSGIWSGLRNRTPEAQEAGIFNHLSLEEFSVVGFDLNASNNLACTVYSMVLDIQDLAMHFYKNHTSEVQVPSPTTCC
uniref:BED-type domain-containing protein n=1 Tax=Strongyloides papillosus TaxID=174720 RepID=A0A0N5B8Y8_STREA